MLAWSCSLDVFLYAGDPIFFVHAESMPTTLSSIFRAEQWFKVTGHFFWVGNFELAALGRDFWNMFFHWSFGSSSDFPGAIAVTDAFDLLLRMNETGSCLQVMLVVDMVNSNWFRSRLLRWRLIINSRSSNLNHDMSLALCLKCHDAMYVQGKNFVSIRWRERNSTITEFPSRGPSGSCPQSRCEHHRHSPLSALVFSVPRVGSALVKEPGSFLCKLRNTSQHGPKQILGKWGCYFYALLVTFYNCIPYVCSPKVRVSWSELVLWKEIESANQKLRSNNGLLSILHFLCLYASESSQSQPNQTFKWKEAKFYSYWIWSYMVNRVNRKKWTNEKAAIKWLDSNISFLLFACLCCQALLFKWDERKSFGARC